MTEEPQYFTEAARAYAAIRDLADRCGATGMTFGQADDEQPGRWWAVLTFHNGARMAVEEQPTQEAAWEALATRVLHGGECQGCGKVSVVHVDGVSGYQVPESPTMLDGRKVRRTQEQILAEGVCRWQRIGPRWTRACGDALPEHTSRERLARALAEARTIPAEMIGAARAGRYDDIHTDLAFPQLALLADLKHLGDAGEQVARRVRDGEFDTTEEEYREWRESPEGREEAQMLLDLLTGNDEARK